MSAVDCQPWQNFLSRSAGKACPTMRWSSQRCGRGGAGPLLHAATQVLFEGIPTHPDAGRAWNLVDKYKVGGRGVLCGDPDYGLV